MDTSVTTREPLAIRGAVVIAITAALEFLIAAGVITLSAEAKDALMIAVGALGTAILVLWTRGKVTPVADPHDDQGRELAPVTTIQP